MDFQNLMLCYDWGFRETLSLVLAAGRPLLEVPPPPTATSTELNISLFLKISQHVVDIWMIWRSPHGTQFLNFFYERIQFLGRCWLWLSSDFATLVHIISAIVSALCVNTLLFPCEFRKLNVEYLSGPQVGLFDQFWIQAKANTPSWIVAPGHPECEDATWPIYISILIGARCVIN